MFVKTYIRISNKSDSEFSAATDFAVCLFHKLHLHPGIHLEA